MQDIIRNVYKEIGIRGANTVLFQKRVHVIDLILANDELEEQEYRVLTRWLLGENENTDECLEQIEGLFCEEDESFTKDNEEEFRILCELLLYQYCVKEEKMEYVMMILCGYSIGRKLSSNIMYQKFENMANDKRVSLRTISETGDKFPASINNKLQKSLKELKAQSGEDGDFEYTSDLIDLVVNEINILDKQNKYLYHTNEQLQQTISCQREEMDVLWWMMNGWSETYQKSFDQMTEKELAIAVPVELYDHSQWELCPYSGERIVYEILNRKGDSNQKMAISEYLTEMDENLLNKLNIEEDNPKKVQWIIGVLYCMKQCGLEQAGWKSMFKKRYGADVDSVCLTPYEFANQFQRELELVSCSC